MSLAWMSRGACVGHAVDVWFSDNPAYISRAKEVCAHCPVLQECRSYATETTSRTFAGTGTWGGMTSTERRTMVRAKRNRRDAA